ncbi:aldose 1-epimerase [soil metagenome]
MALHFRQPSHAGSIVTLAHKPYTLAVVPHFGGRIVSFRYENRDLLRRTTSEVLTTPRVYEYAGFPLMPYSGPLFGPGFSFADEDHVLQRTVREEPTATHGDAWIPPFDIVQQDAASVELAYDHVPVEGAFPFRFRGTLRYALSEAGVSIFLQVTSCDHRIMPAGIGFHPYFPRPPGTRLAFSATGVWPADAPEAAGIGCQSLTDGLSFADGPDVSEMVVDRLYEGWNGTAVVTAPDGFRTVVEADGALTKLQIYSPWGYPYVCVEPVSNANDGFNRMARGVANHGVRCLEPDASIAGTIRIFAGGVSQ